jgi:carbonic anhydrase/acetyltransferase-like protein (isoleucine patch superfamily)
MGIGLALARELVELHGGTIQARSDGIGKGSEFIVRLPLRGNGHTARSCALPRAAPVNIRTYRNIAPVLGARVYVDPSAIVIGRVKIGDDSSIWPAAVVRGDVHSIEIGARTSIQDGSVLHVTHDGPYSPGGRSLHIGADVTIGHRVTLHACTIGNKCLVGMGSVVLDAVVTEDLVMIGAGSVVPPGKRLETRGLYVGSPARRVRDLTQAEIDFFTYSAAHYVQLKNDYLGTR